MTNTTNNTTEVQEVTMEALATAFEGKRVNISPVDYYGIALEIYQGTIEYENDLNPELWLVSRDSQDNVTGSICIDEEAIESIEAYDDGKYAVNFTLNMAAVDISEYKSLKQLQKERAEKQKA